MNCNGNDVQCSVDDDDSLVGGMENCQRAAIIKNSSKMNFDFNLICIAMSVNVFVAFERALRRRTSIHNFPFHFLSVGCCRCRWCFLCSMLEIERGGKKVKFLSWRQISMRFVEIFFQYSLMTRYVLHNLVLEWWTFERFSQLTSLHFLN